MEKKVNVKFHMAIEQGGQHRDISFTSPGHQRLDVVDSALFMTLTFQEPVMETDERISVKMLLSPKELKIIRQGQVKGLQRYRLQERTACTILTEYGTIRYDVVTYQLSYDESSIHLAYAIILADQVEGRFTMTIRIESYKEWKDE